MTVTSDYIHQKGVITNTKGHKLLKFVSIEDGVAEILDSCNQDADYETTIADFVTGLQSTKKVSSGNMGDMLITPKGFQQLVKDRLSGPTSIFNDKRVTEGTKLTILQELARGERGVQPITVRTSRDNSGNQQVYRIDPASTSYFDKRTLAMTMLNLYNQGIFPDKTQFMTLGIGPGALDMRLISNEWDFTFGENGHSQRFMGNLVINNDPKVLGVKAAVTRWECLNSTIGSSVCQLEHQYADYNQFLELLGRGVSHILQYSQEMMNQMKNFQEIEAASPMLIFTKVGQELGVPKYAMKVAEAYWKDQGQGNTLYDIVQAISAGAQQESALVTTKRGNVTRLPNWGKRARIEEKVWELALKLKEMHVDGPGIDHYPECDKCHQLLPEPKEVVLN